MPIFEYICRDCQHPFEALVSASRPAHCPTCDSDDLEKQLSVFAVPAKSGSGSAPAPSMGACGSCGDPRGPGSCRLD